MTLGQLRVIPERWPRRERLASGVSPEMHQVGHVNLASDSHRVLPSLPARCLLGPGRHVGAALGRSAGRSGWGDEKQALGNLSGLGSVVLREGRNDEATALLRESLDGFGELADKEGVIWSLGHLAAVAAFKGDAERATTLIGAIDTLREETGHVAPPYERRLDEQRRNALASELGEERFAAAHTLGREMTFDHAVDTPSSRPTLKARTGDIPEHWPRRFTPSVGGSGHISIQILER